MNPLAGEPRDHFIDRDEARARAGKGACGVVEHRTHGGGAVPFHWGRFRGIAQDQKRPPLPELMKDNVFFDTCVYHQPGIDLLLKVVPIDNILFASEMVGAVRGIDPETGFYYDDTKRYIDGSSLSATDKQKIFEGNIRRVFPRLGRGQI